MSHVENIYKKLKYYPYFSLDELKDELTATVRKKSGEVERRERDVMPFFSKMFDGIIYIYISNTRWGD